MKRCSATPECRLEYQRQHRALAATLRDRNAAQARALHLAHLRQVRTNLLSA
jgi:DNA-binding FadR family transcriptional regulator